MVVYGLNDTVVKPSEGQKSVEHWRKNLHCDAGGGTKSEQCVEYTHCAAGQRLRKCELPGVGHDVAASTPAAVWSFFASFL
jgi:poly(3-hydroxybutyrate) depolymerase